MPELASNALPTSAAYVRLILLRFGRTDGRRAALLEESGISEVQAGAVEPDDEIQMGQLVRLVRAVNRLEPPGWELDLVGQLDAAAHGASGMAVVSAPTLGDALEVLRRFGHVRVPYYRIAVDTGPSRCRVVIEERTAIDPAARTPLLLLLLFSLQAVIESARGMPLDAGSLDIAVEAPPYGDRLRERFHVPVRFGREATVLAFPSSWLPSPSPLADPSLYSASLAKLEPAARRLEGGDFVVARVESLIEASGSAGLTLDEAASRLALSRRTLTRRLSRAGTSFRKILDDRLQARAARLLADPELTVAEIGYQLGYTDPANFARACKRWFGVSPRRFRERDGRARER